MEKRNLIELAGTIVLIAIAYVVAKIFGAHGIFGIMCVFFFAVTILSFIDRKEMFFALMWLIFTTALILLYIWQAVWIQSLA